MSGRHIIAVEHRTDQICHQSSVSDLVGVVVPDLATGEGVEPAADLSGLGVVSSPRVELARANQVVVMGKSISGPSDEPSRRGV